jgi:hypothetical protein
MRLRVFLILLLVGACRREDASDEAVIRVPLPSPELRGVSGLARVPGTIRPLQFLAVPERGEKVVPIMVEESRVLSGLPVPIHGVPPDTDLEGIAFYLPESDPTRLVFATEARHDRSTDLLLLAEMVPGAVKVRGQLRFEYAALGVKPEPNRGLEGVCVANRRLITVSEMVAEREGGGRAAPLGVYDLDAERWRYHWVQLTTDRGKLSGLTCAAEGPRIAVTAIERHFDVLVVVRFQVGDDSPSLVPSQRWSDLRPRFRRSPPNFEGIERLDARSFLLVTDNDYGGVSGPTEVIRFDSPAPPPSPRPAKAS